MFSRLESEPFAEWTLLSFNVLFSSEASAYALYPWPKTGAVKNKFHAFPRFENRNRVYGSGRPYVSVKTEFTLPIKSPTRCCAGGETKVE